MSDLSKRVEALRTQVKAMGGGAKIFQEWLVKKLDALLVLPEAPDHMEIPDPPAIPTRTILHVGDEEYELSQQIAHGEDARALRSLLVESLEEGKPVRAWHELTDAERKEWNDGVMDPEAGRHTFQSFDHAYRLIVGREMPRTQQGDAALRGTGEGKP